MSPIYLSVDWISERMWDYRGDAVLNYQMVMVHVTAVTTA